jgi:hypothetical protein
MDAFHLRRSILFNVRNKLPLKIESLGKEEGEEGWVVRGGKIWFVKLPIDGQEHRSLIKEKLKNRALLGALKRWRHLKSRAFMDEQNRKTRTPHPSFHPISPLPPQTQFYFEFRSACFFPLNSALWFCCLRARAHSRF